MTALNLLVIEIIAGNSCSEVQVTSFQNDAVNFANKDDVLTYLIHLGYLAYDQNTERAFVPNEEIRQELIKSNPEEKVELKWNRSAKTAMQQIKSGIIQIL